MITMQVNWKHYPDEEPTEEYGEYLCRGIAVTPHTMHYYVCTWINKEWLHGFYYNGNRFDPQVVGEVFDWVSVKDFE